MIVDAVPSAQEAAAFAADWIAAWNAHDIERILAHYGDDVVFLSPVAARRTGAGRVEGLAALRRYWSEGLAAQTTLKFELVDVLIGFASLTISYRNHRHQRVAESFEFGASGKVVRAMACYST